MNNKSGGRIQYWYGRRYIPSALRLKLYSYKVLVRASQAGTDVTLTSRVAAHPRITYFEIPAGNTLNNLEAYKPRLYSYSDYV